MRPFSHSKTRFLGWSVLLVVALLVRIAALEWGLVHASGLKEAGYPMLADAASLETDSRGRIYGSYVYDEESFIAFAPFYRQLSLSFADWRAERISLAQFVRQVYLGGATHGDSDMAIHPLGPALFTSWSAWIAKARHGFSFSSNNDKWHTIHFRYGRWLTLGFSFLSAGLFVALVRQTMGIPYGAASMAVAGLFLFQHTLLTHSRFITYNILAIALMLTCLWVTEGLFRRLESGEPVAKRAAALGLCIGAGFTLKWTLMPVFGVCLGSLVVWGIWTRQWRPIFLTLAISGGALLSALILLLPGILSQYGALAWENQERMIMGKYLTQGSGLYRYFHYFFKTLPAGLGWPLYLIGAAGILVSFKEWRCLSRIRIMTLALLFLYLLLYPSNDLGITVQRALDVYALWLFPAVWFIHWTFSHNRRVGWSISAFLALGIAFSSLSTTVYLRADNPGYRNQASSWVLRHIPPGDTLCHSLMDRHYMIDISIAELRTRGVPNPYYHWVLSNDCGEGFAGTGIVALQSGQGAALQVFEPTVKQEPAWHRRVRQLLGYHRWDQIIHYPTLACCP